MSSIDRELIVNETQVGERFDKVLAIEWSDYSRSKIQQWIEGGHVLLNGEPIKPRQKSKLGDHCILSVELEAVDEWQPEPMDLQVVHEDSGIIIINKPANLVVHPAIGNWSGTLVNGLLHNYPELESLPRAGIVHRLDKDTTGLMVVARTLEAHHGLVKAMQERQISRQYQALVCGHPPQASFSVDDPIGRHPRNRLKMGVVSNGKPARTHFRIRETLGQFVLFDVKLDTGRTHQIRVHLAHVGLPIFGDQLYGNNNGGGRPGQRRKQKVIDISMDRQALHAWRLRLQHPLTGEPMAFEGRLPEDLLEVLTKLREEAK